MHSKQFWDKKSFDFSYIFNFLLLSLRIPCHCTDDSTRSMKMLRIPLSCIRRRWCHFSPFQSSHSFPKFTSFPFIVRNVSSSFWTQRRHSFLQQLKLLNLLCWTRSTKASLSSRAGSDLRCTTEYSTEAMRQTKRTKIPRIHVLSASSCQTSQQDSSLFSVFHFVWMQMSSIQLPVVFFEDSNGSFLILWGRLFSSLSEVKGTNFLLVFQKAIFTLLSTMNSGMVIALRNLVLRVTWAIPVYRPVRGKPRSFAMNRQH